MLPKINDFNNVLTNNRNKNYTYKIKIAIINVVESITYILWVKVLPLQNNNSINNLSNHISSDMATILKMLEPFAGNESEYSNRWIQKLLAKCQPMIFDQSATKTIESYCLKRYLKISISIIKINCRHLTSSNS
jgi:hypothetical protein